MMNMNNVLRRSLCVLTVFTTLLSMTACAGKQEPLRAPMETSKMQKTVEVETVYGPIQFPEVLAGKMHHEEAVEDDIAVEVFYMVSSIGNLEVFRIYYADPDVGARLGYLTTDAGEISVTYAMCEYADEDFPTEEDRILFYNMMAAFTVVTDSIQKDERFSELRAVEQVNSSETKFRYWNVTLPENVKYEENEMDGIYRVDFYAIMGDMRVDLYYLGIGEMEADTVLGYFAVDGYQKPVVVGSCNMDEYDSWSDEEKLIIYNMMDSLNGVIQDVVTHKNFSQYVG